MRKEEGEGRRRREAMTGGGKNYTCIAQHFRGSLISQIFHRSQKYFNKNFDARHMHCSHFDCRSINGQHLVPKNINFATLGNLPVIMCAQYEMVVPRFIHR